MGPPCLLGWIAVTAYIPGLLSTLFLSWCSDFDSRKQGLKGKMVKDDPRRYPDKESIGIFGEDGGHIVCFTEASWCSSEESCLHDAQPGALSCCLAAAMLSTSSADLRNSQGVPWHGRFQFSRLAGVRATLPLCRRLS